MQGRSGGISVHCVAYGIPDLRDSKGIMNHVRMAYSAFYNALTKNGSMTDICYEERR
jgi:hypothetical protein